LNAKIVDLTVLYIRSRVPNLSKSEGSTDTFTFFRYPSDVHKMIVFEVVFINEFVRNY